MIIPTHTLRLVGILSCLTYQHATADDSSTDDGDVDICLEKNNFAASIDEGNWYVWMIFLIVMKVSMQCNVHVL